MDNIEKIINTVINEKNITEEYCTNLINNLSEEDIELISYKILTERYDAYLTFESTRSKLKKMKKDNYMNVYLDFKRNIYLQTADEFCKRLSKDKLMAIKKILDDRILLEKREPSVVEKRCYQVLNNALSNTFTR